MYLRLVRDSASTSKECLQKEVMAALTSNLKAFLGGGEIMVCRGSGREYCWLRSLTRVNHEFLMLWWRAYRPCWKRMLDGPRRATMWRRVNWCLWTSAGAGREPDRKYRAGAGVLGWRRWSLCRVSLL